jgi:hypothetical protein
LGATDDKSRSGSSAIHWQRYSQSSSSEKSIRGESGSAGNLRSPQSVSSFAASAYVTGRVVTCSLLGLVLRPPMVAERPGGVILRALGIDAGPAGLFGGGWA